MKRQFLRFLLCTGLALAVGTSLLTLLLWLPHVAPLATSLEPFPVMQAVDAQGVTTVAEPHTAARQTNEGDITAWRAWQQLSPKIQAKVDGRILAELRGEIIPAHLGGDPAQNIVQPQKLTPREKTRFLVYLQAQPDLSQLETLVFASQAEQRMALLQLLRTTAETQQAALQALLEQRVQNEVVSGYQPFYVVNAIALEGGLSTVIELAQRADVARIVANYPLLITDPTAAVATAGQAADRDGNTVDDSAAAGSTADNTVSPNSADDVQFGQWNIDLVDADQVWARLGIRGEGAVVAGFDTGVDYRHPALVEQYRGNLGNDQFDHNYNWFEPDGNLYPNGDLGPSVSDEPYTCNSHGTHTMGTMVGDGGTSFTQVGMAPNAKWIALPGICTNTMGGGISDDIGGLKAFQWVLCPTDLSGELATADCAKAPDVVNNSWGSANPVTDLFRPIIRTLRAANVAPVFAAGNPYADAGSIGTPANAPEAITVGATDASDFVAYFSGRGPSYYPGEQKPELSAPGVSVYSSVGTGSYETASGTSMAAPHVAGLIALMVSADLQDGVRDFTIDEIETFMIRTAVDLGPAGPDDDYGYGRIDAYAAVNAVLQAGDLRGVVRDARSDMPLGGVQVTGHSGAATFHAETGAQGTYSLTVPAGTYNVTINAWGYPERRFTSQLVVAGAQSIADFALEPLPLLPVAGDISDVAGPVAGAQVFVAAAPTISTSTGTNGNYTLDLPVGTHTLVVEKAGYHIARHSITVSAGGVTDGDIELEPAPTILLIEADVFRGWFDGWPIDLFFRTALDEYAYRYEHWPIQDPAVEGTFTRADGSTGYGLPTLAILNQYDVIIWIQSGCNYGSFGCYLGNSPSVLGVTDALTAYMDNGGRVIFSGQDLGDWEDGGTLFTDYLHTSLLSDDAAYVGDSLTGLGFLANLQLTVTNASLYGHSNGTISLAPDAISAISPLEDAALDGVAAYDVDVFPILQYDETQLPAAIAVDSCSANYRAVYFGVGYENIAQRADERSPAITATLDKSIAWVSAERSNADVALVATKALRFGPADETLTHEIRLVNRGAAPVTVTVSDFATQWPTTLYIGDEPAAANLTLQPCQAVLLELRVAIPAETINGSRDPFTVTVTAREAAGQPLLSRDIGLTSVAFQPWLREPSLMTPRHQLGVATLPANGTSGDPLMLYALGGWYNTVPVTEDAPEVATTFNTRFNSCSNTWEPMAELPTPRAGMAVTTLNGEIYAIGGGSQIYRSYYSTVESHDNLWRYSPTTDSWTELAPLPVSLVGAAAATWNGKIYLFGGMAIGYVVVEDFGLGRLVADVISDQTYIYDPATDSWSTGAAVPDEKRFFAAAVPVGNELMLAGGWPSLDLVHFYNPATNSWRTGRPMLQGRHSFGLVAATAADGAIYAVGGGAEREDVGTVERFLPTTGRWESVPMLLDDGRYGVAAGYAGGRIWAVGGAATIANNESLAIGDSFCLSTAGPVGSASAVDAPVPYQFALHGGSVDLPTARIEHRLPAETRFGRFVANPLGAAYDSAKHAVVWQGAVPARQVLDTVRYEVTVDAAHTQAIRNQATAAQSALGEAVTPGTSLSSTVRFEDGRGFMFERSADVLLLASDIDASSKEVAQQVTRSGDQLTYTITIQGNNFINRDVTLRDPLPATLAYVPNSLRYSSGSGRYDAATHTIEWSGQTTQPEDAFINLTNDYQWGDSDGRGEVGDVSYRWTDISATGTAVGGGDIVYYCDLPVGFDFPFYDQVENSFCVSTNGFISFDQTGYAMDYNYCPFPTPYGNDSMIAVIWDDLVVYGSIYYQTFGTVPNRYLVVQWSGVQRYASFDTQMAEFQAVLFENGVIHFFINELGGLQDRYSTTGLDDSSGQRGVTYACEQSGVLHDQQAITFIPPNTTVGNAEAKIRFRAVAGTGFETDTNLVQQNGEFGVNVPVTNTVFITLAQNGLTRQATTLLNPLDLSNTTFAADRTEVTPEQSALYELTLRNDGLIAADQATATVQLPAALAYDVDSLRCGNGICTAGADGTLQWTGMITPQLPTTVTFAAHLATAVRDRTLLTTTATVADGYGTTYTMVADLLARRSDLSQSQFTIFPRFGAPGYKVVVLATLQNTGAVATNGEATITLPATLQYVEDSLVCGTGTCTIAEDGPTNLVVQWQGQLGPRHLVPLRLQVRIPPDAAYEDAFNATLTFNDLAWDERFDYDATVQAMNIVILPTIVGDVQRIVLYLPLVMHD